MLSLDNLVIEQSATLRDALAVINKNGTGLCLVVDGESLVGIASDGDIRRYLINHSNLEATIGQAMNKQFVALPIESKDSVIREHFRAQYKVIPLVNSSGKLVDVADGKVNHRIPVLEPEFKGNELEYVTDCINSGWISSQGAYVSKFEKIFEEYHSGYRALSVANGTTALHLALVTLGVGPEDEVIVPDATFAATINSVIYCRATPVLCDIDPATWCIDVDCVEKLISAKTKAIIVVHLYGKVANLQDLVELTRKHNILLVEDCAEALGSKWRGKPVGTFGDAATFSFFGNKTITTGEGGMVLFKTNEQFEYGKILRDHGMNPKKRYWHEYVGFNYRLTNLQAAVGVAQFERFEEICATKRLVWDRYRAELANCDDVFFLDGDTDDCKVCPWLVTGLLKERHNRDRVMLDMLNHGIETRPTFYPLHEMPPYAAYRRSPTLMHSRRLSESGICLPSSITLKLDEINYICRTLKNILNR